MKKILLVFAATVIALTSSIAQTRELQFYKSGGIVRSIPFLSIDSVRVSLSLNAPAVVNAQLSDTTIDVSWTAMKGATSYQVYRSGDNSTYSLLKNGIRTTKFTDASPLDGLNYYKVKAVGNSLESLLSAASEPVTFYEENGLLAGVYMGIIGFNNDLIDKGTMSLLAPNTKSSFTTFVNNLSTEMQTLLYFGIDKGLEKLTATPFPRDLHNVAIVTFTDGLDLGSPKKSGFKYPNRDEYRNALKNQIRSLHVQGLSLSSYTIGLRGGDVDNDESYEAFQRNLSELANPADKAKEIKDMAELDAQFQKIARDLIDETRTMSLKIKTPTIDAETLIRFTFDNVSNASQSQCYIEGTLNAIDNMLTNVKYVGLTCESGTLLQGTEDETGMVEFIFENVHKADGSELQTKYVNEYYWQSTFWQVNQTEFSQGENVKEIVKRKSAAIMLVLDCSKSLDKILEGSGETTTMFNRMKSAVNNFINTLAAVMDNVYMVSSITLNNSTLTINTGSTAQLTATVSPSNASSKTVKWTSSNTNIATVDYDGVVTAVSPGTCTITATAKDGSGKQASCAVTVPKLVTSISLNKKTLYVNINATAQLTATVSPSDATNKSVTWTSSNTGVATVNSNGVVTGVSVGSCTITATAKDGSGKQASCAVTVQKPVTSITLNYSSLKIKSNSIYQLSATVSPSDATNRSVTWASSNTSVATVRSNGLVNGIADGTCTITATANDGSGKRGTCTITVWTDRSGSVNGHDYVDLGLGSGTLWATCNVGATSPEKYGDYYAWGETTTKSNYDWSTYKYCNGYNDTMTKYCTSSSYGTVDNKTTLELSDDVARASWGGSWRMPTISQFDELNSTCTWSWTTLNGIKGYKVTGPNGNSIFLPAAGCRDGESLYDAGSSGDYWSSSLDTSYASGARMLNFTSSYRNTSSYGRCYGRSVRPVIE